MVVFLAKMGQNLICCVDRNLSSHGRWIVAELCPRVRPDGSWSAELLGLFATPTNIYFSSIYLKGVCVHGI